MKIKLFDSSSPPSTGDYGYSPEPERKQDSVTTGIRNMFKGAKRKMGGSWKNWSDMEIRQEMDRILAKVGQSGINSLTDKEQQYLKEVSKYYQRKSS